MNPDKFDDFCSRLTGALLFVSVYGVPTLLILNAIFG